MTLLEAIEMYYDYKRDYKTEIRNNFKGSTGLEKEDGEAVYGAIELVQEGNVEGAVSYLEAHDTEVREIFYRMLENKKGYDWHGNPIYE